MVAGKSWNTGNLMNQATWRWKELPGMRRAKIIPATLHPILSTTVFTKIENYIGSTPGMPLVLNVKHTPVVWRSSGTHRVK